MFTYRYTTEFSMPAPTTTGRYLWTNSYHFTSEYNRGNLGESPNHLRVACLNSISEGCYSERVRIESWPDTERWQGEVVGQVAGNLPGADRILLGNAVYLKSGDKQTGLWYKKLRGLLRGDDIVGGLVHSNIINWLGDVYIPHLASVPLVNYLGHPVGVITISPRVHMWQMRHGTYRAARSVLGPELVFE